MLYIFYNASLLETCEADIDNMAILAYSDTTLETCKKLKLVLEKVQH
jgi:hypothetical protein